MKSRVSFYCGLVLILISVLFGCGANAAEITLRSGKASRPAGPAFVISKQLDVQKNYTLIGPADKSMPIQADEKGRWWFWSPEMRADEAVTYKVLPVDGHKPAVKLERVKDGLIEVTIEYKLFTVFNFGKDDQKPFLYPVIGPTDAGVTRDFPMKDNPVEKANKRQDHEHHQSFWTAFGDVRTGDLTKPGATYWQNSKLAGGRQAVKRIVHMDSGPVFGQLQAEIEWLTIDGKRQMTEYRTYTFFRACGSCRIVDQQNVFKFTDGDVMIADSDRGGKEGGVVALRIATSMDEVGGGRMCNSRGGVGKDQCWGKAAEWCDYVGKVKGETVGIAVMDAKSNFRHPTRWHIRDYGLYTANPIGLSNFIGEGHDGSKVFKNGESARFNYRIYIHKGDTKAARVADRYRSFIEPLQAIIK